MKDRFVLLNLEDLEINLDSLIRILAQIYKFFGALVIISSIC